MEGKPPVDPAWRTGARIVALVAAIAAFWLAREAILLAFLVIVLGLFLVNEPQTYRKGLRLLVPSRFEEPFETSYEKVSSGLRKWVGGILVSMTIMGTLTAIGLAIAGIKGWLVLGILTF